MKTQIRSDRGLLCFRGRGFGSQACSSGHLVNVRRFGPTKDRVSRGPLPGCGAKLLLQALPSLETLYSRDSRGISRIPMCNAKLVRPERFELPTYSSGGCRSIQLSYGRAADSSSVHGRRGRLNDCGEAGIPVETRLDTSLACSIAGDGASPVSTCISKSYN